MSKIILIDAGHGGLDNGAAKYVKEDEANLKAALAAGRYLTELGYTVKYTRIDDKKLDLNTRAALANKYQCDACVSIHHNAGKLCSCIQ